MHIAEGSPIQKAIKKQRTNRFTSNRFPSHNTAVSTSANLVAGLSFSLTTIMIFRPFNLFVCYSFVRSQIHMDPWGRVGTYY